MPDRIGDDLGCQQFDIGRHRLGRPDPTAATAARARVGAIGSGGSRSSTRDLMQPASRCLGRASGLPSFLTSCRLLRSSSAEQRMGPPGEDVTGRTRFPYAAVRRPTSPRPSSSTVARSDPLRSRAARPPMKAITAPASDTYVPISTERPVSPTSIRMRRSSRSRSWTAPPQADRRRTTTYPLVRPHQGGHHKEGKTDSHHDAAVGN